MTMVKNIVKSKIIIISKNHSYSYLIEEILSKCDINRIFEFIKAPNIKVGIEKAVWESPHLIIIDTDKELDEIKELDFFKNRLPHKIPILFLIDIENENKNIEKLFLDRYDFIIKPINHRELKIRANYLINLYKNYLQKEINQTFLIDSIIEKRADEIEKRKNLFKGLMNSCDNMICIVDKDMNILEINKSWIQNFGSRDFTNKLLKDEKLLRKFIPIYEDKTYLNNYEKEQWSDKLKEKNPKVSSILISKKGKTELFKIEIQTIRFSDKEEEENRYILSLRPFGDADFI